MFDLESGQEFYEADRFERALTQLESGDGHDIDPREDPDLSLNVSFAEALLNQQGQVQPIESYVRRSRSIVLLSMGSVVRGPQVAQRFTNWKGWNLFVPAAAGAAAVAVVMLFLTTGLFGNSEDRIATALDSNSSVEGLMVSAIDPEVASGLVRENQTPSVIEVEVDKLQLATVAVEGSINRGEAPSRAVLQELVFGIDSAAQLIKSDARDITQSEVVRYITATADARSVLSIALLRPERDVPEERAVQAAHAAAEGGIVVASRFFSLRQ